MHPDSGSVVLRYDAHQYDEFHARFCHYCNQYHASDAALLRPPTNEIDALANKIRAGSRIFSTAFRAPARAVVQFCKSADREIKIATDNVLDLKMILAVGVAASRSLRWARPLLRRCG